MCLSPIMFLVFVISRSADVLETLLPVQKKKKKSNDRNL